VFSISTNATNHANISEALELKFIYSKKATKFYKISTVDLTVTAEDKSTEVDFAKF
jgi:hypothetical protein